MTAPLPTYPDALRIHVAQVLRHHFEAGPGTSHGRGISVTGAVIERASMLSMRMSTCPTCLGTKTENIVLTDKRVLPLTCWRCHGDGEIGEIRKTKMQEQTERCRSCKGAGTVPRPEYKLERMYDPHPLKCGACGARGYHHIDTVLCGTGEYPHAQSTPDEGRTEASAALTRLRDVDDRSLLVLSIAYGEVGKRVERQLGLPLAVSLWPHTKHGRRLLARYPVDGEPPWRDMYDGLSTGDATTAMANVASVALLELSLSHLFKADGATGGKVLAMARRLEKEVGKWHK